MPHQNTIAVILAAGKGTRMHSDKPKVLQSLLGVSMLGLVAHAARGVAAQVLTVVGHGEDQVRKAHPELADGFVLQQQQLGTGHALQMAWERVRASGASHCLVINGDTPLLTPEALEGLLESARLGSDLALLSAVLPQAGVYGRVLRGKVGEVTGIVEAKDYDPDRDGPDTGEVNTGLFCLNVAAMENFLFSITDANRAGELYITDLVALAVEAGLRVHAQRCGDAARLMGVNSPLELAQAE
ncbi:MAG: NTP transferase domain-containing protein, partial [Humidesulfovibrio sp.]|nr:NTP transferase domain-containing protein [Humidesulfovibrio sp.]